VYFFGATPDRHLTRLPALSFTHFTPLDAKAKAKQKFISVLPSYSPYTEKDYRCDPSINYWSCFKAHQANNYY